jgi:hypothetical protein
MRPALTVKMKTELMAFLKEELTLEVVPMGFTDPNGRRLVMYIGKEKIAETTFDVVQKPKYEG